jgi:hypothetical protein
MYAVLTAKVLQVGPRQRHGGGRLAKEHLGVTHTAAVDYRRQPIDDIFLSDNVFKLHTLSH